MSFERTRAALEIYDQTAAERSAAWSAALTTRAVAKAMARDIKGMPSSDETKFHQTLDVAANHLYFHHLPESTQRMVKALVKG